MADSVFNSLPLELLEGAEPHELLRAVLDISLTGLVYYRPLCDPAGAVIDFTFAYLNPAAQQMLGLPAQPALTYWQAFPSAQKEFPFHRDTFLAEGAQHTDFYYEADGYDNYFRLAARRLGAGLLVSFTDTADQPRTAAEAALRASRTRDQATHAAVASQREELQRLFEQAPIAIATFMGPQYVIELANPMVCTLWGRTQTQALHTPLFTLLPEAAGQGFEELLDGVMATGVPYVAHELPSFIDRNGRRETVYWNFVYHPLREADGRISGVLVVAADVSEQVAARQQLLATNQQLTRTNAELDTFIYTASHDLWAPISNIEGLLTALRLDLTLPPDEADVPELLNLMGGAVERFKHTIRDLTNVARLQQTAALPTTPVDLAHLVADIQLDLAPDFAATGGELVLDISQCPVVHFTEKNLRSIVYNLLSNGLKYRDPARVPHLVLRCYPTEKFTVLTVRDNGLGLTVAQQGKLFGLFKRQHDHVEGSGIGLYMVKKIVENAGGDVEVESQLGIGSTFLVYLPR